MIEVDIKLSVIHHSHGGGKKAMQSLDPGPHFENTVKKNFLATIQAALARFESSTECILLHLGNPIILFT